MFQTFSKFNNQKILPRIYLFVMLARKSHIGLSQTLTYHMFLFKYNAPITSAVQTVQPSLAAVVQAEPDPSKYSR